MSNAQVSQTFWVPRFSERPVFWRRRFAGVAVVCAFGSVAACVCWAAPVSGGPVVGKIPWFAWVDASPVSVACLEADWFGALRFAVVYGCLPAFSFGAVCCAVLLGCHLRLHVLGAAARCGARARGSQLLKGSTLLGPFLVDAPEVVDGDYVWQPNQDAPADGLALDVGVVEEFGGRGLV